MTRLPWAPVAASMVKAHLFEMRIRHFGTALEAALFSDNIPVAVYKQPPPTFTRAC